MTTRQIVIYAGVLALGYWLGSKAMLAPAIEGVRRTIGATGIPLSGSSTPRAEEGPG